MLIFRNHGCGVLAATALPPERYSKRNYRPPSLRALERLPDCFGHPGYPKLTHCPESGMNTYANSLSGMKSRGASGSH
jgi:hypothetical protein